MTKIKYEETDKFTREFKKMQKKFKTLADDLKTLQKSAIELFHLMNIDNNGILEIQGVGNTNELKFFKIKKFACQSLPGRGVRSGLRLIYAYFPGEQRIVFLEIYFKANKENEDRKRISDFLKHQNSD